MSTAVAAAKTGKLTAETTPKGNALPPVIHAKAQPNSGGRIIVVGDVHGCLDELKALLAKCKFDSNKDTLVFVGDLVNKGPYSAQVVSFARTTGALCVRGNHDDSALAAYHKLQGGKKPPAKNEWVTQLAEADAQYLENLPFTLRIGLSLIIVHAGLVPGIPRKKQKLYDMYTMRDVVPAKSGGWKASDQHTPDGEPWAAEWRGPRYAFFGHDAVRQLQLRPQATGLDTGCVYGGRLTACILPAAPAPQFEFFAWLKSKLRQLLNKNQQAPMFERLGGHIVSVPSQQPPRRS